MILDTTDLIISVMYFFLLFLSIFWLIVLVTSKEDKQERKMQRFPLFTVIVPAFNEQGSIVQTLESALKLDYPPEKVQIIVVNDGSTDRTKALVEEVIKGYPHRDITLINQENKGKGSAMNNGLKFVKGEFFASLDADSFVSPDALKKMIVHFDADPQLAAVCPLLKVKKPENTLQKVQWYEYLINMFYRQLNAHIDCIHVTPGPFSIYRTKVVQDLGGYDEKNLTEDLEIAIRLQKHHYKIIQRFDAVVETVTPQTWRSLFRQRERWYKGSIDNALAYKSLMFNKNYGDFGFLRMPTIIASGAIAIILTVVLLQQVLSRAWSWLSSLQAVNYDLLTLIKGFTFQFNILSLPFFKVTIAVTLMAISFFIMMYSFKVVEEKITNHGRTWVSLLLYLTVYSIFISTVWIAIAFRYASRRKDYWK